MDDKQDLVNNEQAPAQVPPPYTLPPHQPPHQPPVYQTYNPGHVQQQQYAGQVPYMFQTAPAAPNQVTIVRHVQVPPKDYLVMAILVTIFCCLPFGIVGIIKASEAKDLYAAGNYQEAERASMSARTWSKAGLITGIVISSISVAIVVVWIVIVASVVASSPDYDY